MYLHFALLPLLLGRLLSKSVLVGVLSKPTAQEVLGPQQHEETTKVHLLRIQGTV